jgi:predicted RNA binding protein YcfA (HicA-like mRNA interferase family)
VLAALTHCGFSVHREGGSHTIMRRNSDGVQIAVPRHRELQRGTVRGMAEDAGVAWDKFQKEIA